MTSTDPKLLDTAIAQHRAGQLDAADRLYKQVIANDPENAQALHLSGVVALQKGNAALAIQRIEIALQLNPHEADAQINLGNAYLAAQRFEDAVNILSAALERQAEHAQLLASRGFAHTQLKDYALAIADFEHAVALQPELTEAWRNLAIARLETHYLLHANEAIEKALQLEPQSAAVHHTLGNIELAMGRTDAAIQIFDRLRDSFPDHLGTVSSLAQALSQRGNTEAANAQWQHAIRLSPNDDALHLQAGITLRNGGELEQARDEFSLAIQLNPANGAAHHALARMTRYATDNDAAVAHLEQMQRVLEGVVSKEDRMMINFALGKAHGDLNHFDQAFAHYQRANDLNETRSTNNQVYKIDGDLVFFEQLKQTFTLQRVEAWRTTAGPHASSPSNNRSDPTITPVFILGMPRSGTSLVEQIVASHPSVAGGGEITAMPLALAKTFTSVGDLDYTEALRAEPKRGLAELSDRYVQQLHAVATRVNTDQRKLDKNHVDVNYVTDKLPANFMHIGCITTALPAARIVHCRRDPMDTCWSMYKNHFPASGHQYSCDLITLGKYYRGYAALMQHWQDCGIEIIEVSYEALVNNTKATTEKLLEQLNLPWNDACLQFHCSTRAVSTLSAEQVRQPIYRDSLNAWQPYAAHLQQLQTALDRD